MPQRHVGWVGLGWAKKHTAPEQEHTYTCSQEHILTSTAHRHTNRHKRTHAYMRTRSHTRTDTNLGGNASVPFKVVKVGSLRDLGVVHGTIINGPHELTVRVFVAAVNGITNTQAHTHPTPFKHQLNTQQHRVCHFCTAWDAWQAMGTRTV